MSALRRWWRGWRCHNGHHWYVKAHPAIWNGAYVLCRDCGHRDVHGGDRYGPAAVPWISSGRVPPSSWTALTWAAEDWKRWKDTRPGQVHNHSPEEGLGLACPERRLPDGSLRGECMTRV